MLSCRLVAVPEHLVINPVYALKFLILGLWGRFALPIKDALMAQVSYGSATMTAGVPLLIADLAESRQFLDPVREAQVVDDDDHRQMPRRRATSCDSVASLSPAPQVPHPRRSGP